MTWTAISPAPLRVVSGLGLPPTRLLTRLLEHVLAERQDQPGLLGQGHEFRRPDDASARMLPAHQRLLGDQAAGVEVDDRLEVQRELLALDREPQLLLQTMALEHRGAHARVEHLELALARGLGLVHGHVGVADELLGRKLAAVAGGDADADVDRNALRPDADRQDERLHDSARDLDRGVLRVLRVLDHHREFVAAQTRDHVLGSQASA